MKHKLLCCTAFMCGIFTFPFASALAYHYSADLYPNHFYAPTSSNRALDIDSADNSGGAAIIVPSAGMGTGAESTAPREGSPVILVGSYVPMGCRTGFYMSLIGTPDEQRVADAWKAAMEDVLKVQDQNQIPELNVYQCGTYQMHSLQEAQDIARSILERDVRINSNEELALPKEKLQELHI